MQQGDIFKFVLNVNRFWRLPFEDAEIFESAVEIDISIERVRTF